MRRLLSFCLLALSGDAVETRHVLLNFFFMNVVCFLTHICISSHQHFMPHLHNRVRFSPGPAHNSPPGSDYELKKSRLGFGTRRVTEGV